MIFIFDLDGTITRQETLPLIAEAFDKSAEIEELTRTTINGNIPFIESFIHRLGILRDCDVQSVSDLLADVPYHDALVAFIKANASQCAVATGNLDVWVDQMVAPLGCAVFTSKADVADGKVKKVATILQKEEVVRHYQAQGEQVVFVGDGNNDAEAMRIADISIACGLVHDPAPSVVSVCDFAVYSEAALLRLLGAMLIERPSKHGHSLVLSCAGVGSRLGLNSTKALINFRDRPLIQWQIESFGEINDIRVVVGYQASQVIRAVRAIRDDVIFAYNHDYFSTGTGRSLYLGARYGAEYITAWDGDLLVHKGDMARCLRGDREYLGVSDVVTDDGVYAHLDAREEQVKSFSRDEASAFEWSGPACFKASHINENAGHVFEAILDQLPMPALKIRAFDIDTHNDYQHAQSQFSEFFGE
ncbi:MAG: HAD-IB family phosphatase [Pseudomonadota bacterium]